MDAPPDPTTSDDATTRGHIVAHLDDLPVGSLQLVRAGGQRLCLARTAEGVFALDHACPHEGYGLVQGSLDGDLLTCAWHNWKFRVTDGACVLGQEGVATHDATVEPGGQVRVTVRTEDPAQVRDRLLASLDEGIARDQTGRIARDVVRLLRAHADPGELVWRAVAHGAPRAEFGWGHAVASATDCLALAADRQGDDRALPIVQAIAGIYAQKAFELCQLLGWERAPTVLAHLVPTLVNVTREDLLPYLRPFLAGLGRAGALDAADLGTLADLDVDPSWSDEGGALAATVLGPDRDAVPGAAVAALRAGAGVDGLLDVAVAAVSERMLRYDTDGERDLGDDFGWLDITHGLTYADAARWHHRLHPGPDTVRLALWVLFQAQWTGRHEWHTEVPRPPEPVGGAALEQACLTGRPAEAVGAALDLPPERAAPALEAAALADLSGSFIVHAHQVKTSRAAIAQAVHTRSPRPVAAAARFLAAPKLDRFVASTTHRAVAR